MDTLSFNSSAADFSSLGRGWTFQTLADGVSHSGTFNQATLTFDASDHTLYYDPDGAGAELPTAVVRFSNTASVTNPDVQLVAVDPLGH